MQYGEERKVIAIDDTFLSTVKRTFKTARTETLVFQKYDNPDKINNYLYRAKTVTQGHEFDIYWVPKGGEFDPCPPTLGLNIDRCIKHR